MVEAYCVKCKKKVQIANAQKVTLKNGKPATKGSCPNCGTKVFRIGG
jgi:DNA-directed RNA polymerase subunit RPC12/RpoP